MKRFIYSMVALMLSLSISAADKVTEDFSTLTQGDLNGTKELPTGTWSFSSMKYTKSNSVMCLAFSSTSSTVITPAFDKVAKISFVAVGNAFVGTQKPSVMNVGSSGSVELPPSENVAVNEFM